MDWKNRKTHWYEAVSSALNFPFLKDVSQNCLVFDAVNLKSEEVSQNCFVFDVVKCKKIEEVSLNCCVFEAVKFQNGRSLPELLRF